MDHFDDEFPFNVNFFLLNISTSFNGLCFCWKRLALLWSATLNSSIVYCVIIAAVYLMRTLHTHGICIYLTAHHYLDIQSLC